MTTATQERIAILGISNVEDRYAYIAYKTLLDHGYTHIQGVTPKDFALPGVRIVHDLKEVEKPIHTLTLYVGAARLESMIDDILDLNPKRIIMNPGTENENLKSRAIAQGIEVVEGCTIVMTKTGQF